MHAIDRRIGLLFGGFLVLLAIALARAAYLGVFHSAALSTFATSQEIDNKAIPAVRGMITDRDGQVLALSESADKVVADPEIIRNAARTAVKLSPLLGVPSAKLATLLTKPNTGYVTLAYDVPAADAARVMDMHINGINDSPVERRVYPLGATASQVLGWVGSDGKGLAGVEYVKNNLLKGEAGRTRIVNDGNQQAISVSTAKQMVPGAKIALTLSAPLQQEVEQVLAATAKQLDPVSETAIVVDPQTDQVLADANWPAVNANDIGASPASAQENSSVGFSYEPGSTFKAITIAGGLQDGTVTPNTMIDIPPDLQAPGGYTIGDAESHGYESYTVGEVLKYSSNIGADLIAQKDGPENGAPRFNYWVRRFGFGKPTGVAMNGEQQGVLLKLKNYSGDSMYNLPFGQGEEVTPMQMVQAYDAIANGGTLRTPQLIDSIGGRQVAMPKGKRIISPRVASQLRTMMRSVLADGGTASGAQIPGYDLAGKTGTANVAVDGKYSSTEYVASFIGMVPASNPKLVVAVVVNQPQTGSIFGGTAAGPAFQKIVGWAVPHFGINPCPSPCPSSAYAGPTTSTP